MSDYTPTTAEVRNAWWRDQCPKHDLDFDDIYNAAFDRWLAAHDAEVRAAALAEQGETEWEYGARDVQGRVMRGGEDFAYRSMGGNALPDLIETVRRRKAGPWMPVPDTTGAES